MPRLIPAAMACLATSLVLLQLACSSMAFLLPSLPSSSLLRQQQQLHHRSSRLITPARKGGGGGGDSGGGYAEKQEYMPPTDPRLGPPPDLPSLLLHNRIVYLGMALVPAVTELIIAELLYLNYESQDRPIYMYINSPGISTPDGRAMGFDTEAFAIADVMSYIRAPIATVCVGQCYGSAAMLLACGTKGQRYSLPNGSIMLHQPRSLARGQASDIAIKAREVMRNRKINSEMLAKACGKPLDVIIKDASRKRYFSPEEACEYGLIDQVLESTNDLPMGLIPRRQGGDEPENDLNMADVRGYSNPAGYGDSADGGMPTTPFG